MAFFTNNGSKIASGPIPQSTFDSSKQYLISEIKGNIIDTSEIDLSIKSGPEDYANWYGKTNAGKLFFTNAVTQHTVVFPSFIDSYNESFKPSFTSEQVYGRTDAYQKFSNTTRNISLAFVVLAYDEEHARKNLHAVSTLVQFLYPTYRGAVDNPNNDSNNTVCNPLVISQTPMIRVRFSNMVQRTGRGDNKDKSLFSFDGLLTTPNDLSFAPNLETGFFISKNKLYLYPKEIKVNMSFNVLHEESLGWIKSPETQKNHWIGKLNDNGVKNTKSVNFPWGSDVAIKVKPSGPNATIAATAVSGEGVAKIAADGGEQ